MSDIEIALKQAERGREIVDTYTPDNKKNNVIAVFPDDDDELLSTAYKYFDRFLADYDYAVVITSIDIEKLSKYTTHPFEIVRINDEDMECMLRYISVCGEASAATIKILSLKKPHCQKAEILNGFKDLTLDKIVCRGLYGIWGEI